MVASSPQTSNSSKLPQARYSPVVLGHRLLWPLLAGMLRLVIAVGGGWVGLRLTGSLGAVFAALALGLVAYGVILSAAIRAGAWFGRDRPAGGKAPA